MILEKIDERDTENVQISEALEGDYSAFFFGNKPRIYSYAGHLYHTKQDDWYTAFTFLYDEILRGTQCAKLGVTVWLCYPGSAINGALLDFNRSLVSEAQAQWAFSFSVLVRKRLNFFEDSAWKPDEVGGWGERYAPTTEGLGGQIVAARAATGSIY